MLGFNFKAILNLNVIINVILMTTNDILRRIESIVVDEI